LPTNNMSVASQKNAQEEIEKAMVDAQLKIKDIERSWEEKLRLQKINDEEEKKMQEQQAKLQQTKDKKAPHLTNLNSDPQLTGKLFYSLANARNQPLTIGRNQSSSLVLKGVGIQEHHAQIKVDELGNFTLSVDDQAALRHTLVNGKAL
jgi:pSer/pThr/pTyr-binding forkhead associated (FHA) protein